MYECVEEVLIQGVVPCMPCGSRILMSLLSSSVPRMPIHILIQKDRRTASIYMRKSEKGETTRMMSK